MSRAAGTVPGEEGFAALRWALGGALALALHGGVALLVIRSASPEPLAAGDAGAVAVELEPVEGEPAKPDEVQPAVPADEETEAAAPAAAAEASRAAPPVETPPLPTPAPVRPDPPPVQPPPEPPPPPVQPPPEPPPPPVAPEPARPRPVAPPVQATQASAASAAADDAAPAVQRPAAARDAAWRGKLVPHLNRFRRFPRGVGSGTARVAFTIDAEGRVTSVSIASGSGDAALDAAARALVERASPFPAPPPGVTGRALSFVVPVHYDAHRP